MIRKLGPALISFALVGVACGDAPISVTSVEPEEGGFFTQVVDFGGDVGRGLDLTTDTDGNPHLSYLALADEEEGAEAAPSPTPVPGPTGSPGGTPSPEATVLGVPTLPAVMHAHLVDNVLTRSPVADATTGLTAEDETAIAVDAEGTHHVVWTVDGSSLWYSRDFAEQPQEIPLVGDEVSGISIATDEGGTVYVAFTEGTGVEGPGAIVRLGTSTPEGDASVETVAEAGATGPTAVGTGPQGMFVAYGDDGGTLVARREGNVWASDVADEQGGLGIGMAIDADGNPHLSYGSPAGQIRHAHSIDGGPWEASLVGSAGFSPEEAAGFGTGIAVDEEGIHHVAWTDATGISYSNNTDGPFARPEQIPGTQTEPAAESPGVGVGPEGTLFVAWFDPQDTEVQLTQRAEDAPPLALPSPSPTTGAPTDGGQTGACAAEGTDLTIAAEELQFDKDCLAAPAGEPFTIAFDNRDPALHNVSIYTEPAGDELFLGETFTGPATQTYEVDPLDEPGEFYFQCDVHPATMQGSFVVEGPTGGGGGGGGGGNGDGEGGNS